MMSMSFRLAGLKMNRLKLLKSTKKGKEEEARAGASAVPGANIN